MLARQMIINMYNQNKLVIQPFDEQQLGPNSYDVRLGQYFYFPRSYGSVDPYNREDVERFYGDPVKIDDYVVVNPGETILAHTEEFIGSPYDIVLLMHTRSSVERLGIDTNKAAGFGDIGYIGRWTMEISNHTIAPIRLYVGMRIAQFEFQEVSGGIMTADSYKDRHKGKYGDKSAQFFRKEDHQSNLTDMIARWEPSDMLPKLWLDYDAARFMME